MTTTSEATGLLPGDFAVSHCCTRKVGDDRSPCPFANSTLKIVAVRPYGLETIILTGERAGSTTLHQPADLTLTGFTVEDLQALRELPVGTQFVDAEGDFGEKKEDGYDGTYASSGKTISASSHMFALPAIITNPEVLDLDSYQSVPVAEPVAPVFKAGDRVLVAADAKMTHGGGVYFGNTEIEATVKEGPTRSGDYAVRGLTSPNNFVQHVGGQYLTAMPATPQVDSKDGFKVGDRVTHVYGDAPGTVVDLLLGVPRLQPAVQVKYDDALDSMLSQTRFLSHVESKEVAKPEGGFQVGDIVEVTEDVFSEPELIPAGSRGVVHSVNDTLVYVTIDGHDKFDGSVTDGGFIGAPLVREEFRFVSRPVVATPEPEPLAQWEQELLGLVEPVSARAFQVGDRVRLVPKTRSFSAPDGTLATVTRGNYPSPYRDGEQINVTWDEHLPVPAARQMDGDYEPADFELVVDEPAVKESTPVVTETLTSVLDFAVGDKVVLTKDVTHNVGSGKRGVVAGTTGTVRGINGGVVLLDDLPADSGWPEGLGFYPAELARVVKPEAVKVGLVTDSLELLDSLPVFSVIVQDGYEKSEPFVKADDGDWRRSDGQSYTAAIAGLLLFAVVKMRVLHIPS